MTLMPAEMVDVGGASTPLHYGDPEAEYRAAVSGAVVVSRAHEGRLRAVGRDRLDLLHRLSTNALDDLPAGAARPTVLTTAIARIIDLLWVLNLGETLLCLTSPGRATLVRRWLASNIFFNDKVKFEDASTELGQLGVYGPHAGAVVEALLPGAGALQPGRLIEHEGVIALRARPLAGDGFTLVAPQARIDGLWDQAVVAGAAPAGEAAYQMLRLAAGEPDGTHELTEDYIPLEANLWSAVSFTKGCYIGQEIIARMESRGKLARRLAGLRPTAPVAPGAEVRAGDTLAGTVTSAGQVPGLGPVALAYLKSAVAEPGTRVTVGTVDATVASLPFTS